MFRNSLFNPEAYLLHGFLAIHTYDGLLEMMLWIELMDMMLCDGFS